MNKLKNIAKKISNLNVHGLVEGIKNMESGEAEDIAKVRAQICANCPSREIENVTSLAVEDPNNPEISKHYCGECGCALPLLVRQFEKSCELNKWE